MAKTDDQNLPAVQTEEEQEFELQKARYNDTLAQVATATMMAQSLSACLERKQLMDLSPDDPYFELSKRGAAGQSMADVAWIKISQVGRPVDGNLQSCMETMQNILQSCALPHTRLLFLVVGNGKTFKIFMGLKGNDRDITDFQNDVPNFINSSWRGISCQAVKSGDDDYKSLEEYLGEKYSSVHAVTGIPSPGADGGYPGAVEYLMGGQRDEPMAYLVVAEPVAEQEVNNIIDCCNEMQGQAQSMQSFSFAENRQLGRSDSISEAESRTKSIAESIGSNRKSPKDVATAALGVGGLIAAGLAFLPMQPFLSVTAFLTAPVSFGGLGGLGIVSSLIPQRTKNQTDTESSTHSSTESHGTTESYSKSVTRNLVNAHISNIVEHLKKQVARYEEGKGTGMWNVGCYLFSNSGSSTSTLQLKSLLSGSESKYEPIRINAIENFCEKADRHNYKGFITAPEIEVYVKAKGGAVPFSHPFGQKFNGLTTVLTTKELACMANFPLHSVPGINVVEATAGFSLSEQKIKAGSPSIDMGRLVWSGTSTDLHVRLPLDTLSRHALVCGVNGSGKTNTVLSILNGFLSCGRPFFVIEPAKTEYVDWAYKYNETVQDPGKKIKIFIPGCKKYVNAKGEHTPDSLRLNPFEVIKLKNSEMRVLSHIDRLKATFASAFPMQDILPVIMEHLLYFLYSQTNRQMGSDDSLFLQTGFPTLGKIDIDFINDLMLDIGYAAENTQNISAALRTRFNSLRYGWKADLLDNPRLEGMTWDELFGSPVVVNLSYAGDDQDRAFIMSLLLQFLYEYRIAESESTGFSYDANTCRHLVVVEEAHRIMGQAFNPDSPQYKSGLMFSNFLSEVRAYGQGMMVVDQIPTRLIEDAIKNTNIKIIHKLVASDDIQQLGESVGLTPGQQKVIARLSVGQAVLAGFNSANVMTGDSSDIYLAHINKNK